MLDRLSLRIEHRAFRHYPDVCFHGFSITLAMGERARRKLSWMGQSYVKHYLNFLARAFRWPGERVFETHFDNSRSARLPADPCARRSHTLPAKSYETSQDRPWKARREFHGARVSAEDDLRFALPFPSCFARAPVRMLLPGQTSSGICRSASKSINAGSWIAAMPWPMRSAPSISMASRIFSGPPTSPACIKR